MTRGVVPLVGGSVNAHQRFEIQLGDNLVEFELDYKTITERWSVNLLIEGQRIVNGATLEPGADIIDHWGLTASVGRLVFTGNIATLDNLGVANALTWVSPDDNQ